MSVIIPCEEQFLINYYQSLEIKDLLIRAFDLLNDNRYEEFHDFVKESKGNEKDLIGNILLMESFCSFKGEQESDFYNRYDCAIKQTLKLGNPISQYVTGVYYDDAFNQRQDKSKALHYFSLSAKQGFIPSMTNYGIILIYGVCCNKDIDKGLSFLKESKKQGDIIASEFLDNYELS